MIVNIKKLHKDAILPKYSKPGDAGLDLVAVSKVYDKYGNVSYGTGLAFEIPFGYVGLLFPRSSNSKQDLLLSNSVGVLDSGYRGEVSFKFKPSVLFMDDSDKATESDDFDYIGVGKELNKGYSLHLDYNVGDRIGQIIIMPYPQIEFNEVEELSDTERGSDGFGSTGK